MRPIPTHDLGRLLSGNGLSLDRIRNLARGGGGWVRCGEWGLGQDPAATDEARALRTATWRLRQWATEYRTTVHVLVPIRWDVVQLDARKGFVGRGFDPSWLLRVDLDAFRAAWATWEAAGWAWHLHEHALPGVLWPDVEPLWHATRGFVADLKERGWPVDYPESRPGPRELRCRSWVLDVTRRDVQAWLADETVRAVEWSQADAINLELKPWWAYDQAPATPADAEGPGRFPGPWLGDLFVRSAWEDAMNAIAHRVHAAGVRIVTTDRHGGWAMFDAEMRDRIVGDRASVALRTQGAGFDQEGNVCLFEVADLIDNGTLDADKTIVDTPPQLPRAGFSPPLSARKGQWREYGCWPRRAGVYKQTWAQGVYKLTPLYEGEAPDENAANRWPGGDW